MSLENRIKFLDKIKFLESTKFSREEAVKRVGLDLVEKVNNKKPDIWLPEHIDSLNYYFSDRMPGDSIKVIFCSSIKAVNTFLVFNRDIKFKRKFTFSISAFYMVRAKMELDQDGEYDLVFYDEYDLEFRGRGVGISFAHEREELMDKFFPNCTPSYYKIKLLEEDDVNVDVDCIAHPA
jgi:hypothetical protein